MLESAHIINYQIIKDITYKFHPGVNVLTGPSDNGKSASLRAIRKAITNKPTGDRFRTKDTKQTTIKLNFKEGAVEYKKTKTKAQYNINGEVFKALRSDVPDEVYQITGISEENLQKQSGFFLLEDSSGVVARKLNKVSDLEISDDVLFLTNSKIRGLNTDLSYNEDRMNTIKDNLSNLKWVTLADKKLKKIEKKEKEVKEKSELVTELKSLLASAEICISDSASLNLKQAKRDAEYLFKQESDFIDEMTRVNRLDELLTEIESLQKKVQKVPAFDFSYTEVDKLEDEYIELNNLLADHEELTEKLDTAKKKAQQARAKFKAVLKEAGICPLCGSEL